MIPKFRAWDKSLKEMTTVIAIVFENDIVKVRYDNRNMSSDSIENYILMQSTGFLDKNGKEIFEGDVVKMKYTVLSDYEFFKVTRFRGGSWIIDNRKRGSELWLRNEDCEIISNIYEKPELVEVVE